MITAGSTPTSGWTRATWRPSPRRSPTRLAAVDPGTGADYEANAGALTAELTTLGPGLRAGSGDLRAAGVHHQPRRLRLPGQALPA